MTAPRRTTRGRARPPAVQQMPRMPPELHRGRCVTSPHPHIWSSPVPAEREAALLICGACPVRQPCAAWSLSLRTADDLTSVLGGLTPEDRAAIRRARQRALRRATAA